MCPCGSVMRVRDLQAYIKIEITGVLIILFSFLGGGSVGRYGGKMGFFSCYVRLSFVSAAVDYSMLARTVTTIAHVAAKLP